jgi:hypothetical protein
MEAFLTSLLDGGEWSASCFDYFTPGERAPGIGQGAWWSPEPVCMWWQRENFLSLPEKSPGCAAPSESLY